MRLSNKGFGLIETMVVLFVGFVIGSWMIPKSWYDDSTDYKRPTPGIIYPENSMRIYMNVKFPNVDVERIICDRNLKGSSTKCYAISTKGETTVALCPVYEYTDRAEICKPE